MPDDFCAVIIHVHHSAENQLVSRR